MVYGFTGGSLFKKALFVLLLALLPASSFAQDKVFNILYTGGIKGELEPCGCSPKTESGGLARLSGYISSNGGGLSPYILVDAGNSMAQDTPQGRLKAEAVLKSFELMNYDAVAFSKEDTVFPEGFLTPLVRKHNIASVSGHGGPVKVERGALRINISADRKALIEGMVNILLTDMPVADAKKITGWDVIVTSSGEALDEPRKAGGGVIVSGYPRGQKLGVLTVGFDRSGKPAAVSHRWQGLGRDIPEDARVRGVLKDYDGKVAGLLKDEERKVSSGGPYLGVASCVECHQPYVESWSNTRHSGAFISLEKAGKSKDPECVKCHVTGYSQEGGFYSMRTTPGLANVQCEVCHGPGREHVKDVSKPMTPVAEPVCLRCHTGTNSPDFDFKKYFDKIRH